jgi:hypothetical protein
VTGTLTAPATKEGDDDGPGDDGAGDSHGGGSGGGGNDGAPGGFGGDLTFAGCTQALFDGEFTQVHVMRAGPSRLVVNLERRTSDAQATTGVEIEGTLKAAGAAS